MEYFEPNFLDEALVLLDRYGAGARVLAGGTVLGPQLREDARGVTALVNIKRIPELYGVAVTGDALKIGALATARDVADNSLVRRHAPLVAEAAASLGASQLRNMATVGGNACSGAPAADLSLAFLASGARCEITSVAQGPVSLFMEYFFRPGSNALAPEELLTAVEVPCSQWRAAYLKMQTRRAFETALVAVAVSALLEGDRITDARIALGGVAPTPIRATAAEAALAGQKLNRDAARAAARVAADADAQPESDQRASAEYRRHCVAVLAERALRSIEG